MSIDRSLKSGNSLSRHRNVLTRTERIEKLIDDGLWTEDSKSALGLQKVGNRKAAVGKKVKKKIEEGEGEEEAAAVE
jgi:small basic protein (TIGR04137 family)